MPSAANRTKLLPYLDFLQGRRSFRRNDWERTARSGSIAAVPLLRIYALADLPKPSPARGKKMGRPVRG
jgi:hypothetical protein